MQRTRVFPCDQSTIAVRLLEEERIGDDRPQLVGPPSVGTASCGGALQLGDRHARHLAERELQEALAEASRKSAGSPVVRKR